MSDTPPVQPEPPAQVAGMPHVVSTSYASLQPNGYMFSLSALSPMGAFVRIVYYHDEQRPVYETFDGAGGSTFQVVSFRVQDVAVTLSVEDFVRLTIGNLQTIQASHPDILEKYKVHFG